MFSGSNAINRPVSDDDDELFGFTPPKNETLFTRIYNRITNFRSTTDTIPVNNVALVQLLQSNRFKPNDLSAIIERSKFSKEQVRMMYRNFKQENPNGIIDRDSLKIIFKNLFPIGDPLQFADCVFTVIDQKSTGQMTFGDYIEFIADLQFGTRETKLRWAFKFFDMNQDGYITLDEMLVAGSSIYSMILSHSIPMKRYSLSSTTPTCHQEQTRPHSQPNMRETTTAATTLSSSIRNKSVCDKVERRVKSSITNLLSTSISAAVRTGQQQQGESGEKVGGWNNNTAMEEIPWDIRIKEIFIAMDANDDGRITYEEFTVYCLTRPHIKHSFDTLP